LLLGRARMRGRSLSLAPAATGLVIANVIMIGVVIACLFVARRAWNLREEAVAALAQARAATTSAVARPLVATVHARVPRIRATTIDRILLFGVAGIAGSAFFTWLLVRRSVRSAVIGRRRPGDPAANVRYR